MRKLTTAAALVVAIASPAFAAEPYEGSWAYDCTIAAGDLVPTVIKDGRIIYYESECDIDSVTPIGTGDQAWKVTASCQGEGETWDRNMMLAVEQGNEGEPVQLIEIDLDEGYVIANDRCD